MVEAERRMKMFAKETPWGKYLRLNELARHRERCRNMQCFIDNSAPKQSPRQRANRERSDLEQALGGTSNCVGKCKLGMKNIQDDTMRDHQKRVMVHKKRINKIHEGPSVYTPKNRNYLIRGEAPWKFKPQPKRTIDEKLKEIRKWAMRHRVKTPPPPPTGIMAYIPKVLVQAFCTPPEPQPQFVSPITDEDAEKSLELAQLKAVQEAGDPTF